MNPKIYLWCVNYPGCCTISAEQKGGRRSGGNWRPVPSIPEDGETSTRGKGKFGYYSIISLLSGGARCSACSAMAPVVLSHCTPAPYMPLPFRQVAIHAATQLILGQHIVDILPCSIALGMGGPFGYLPGVRFGSKAELAPDARPSRFFPLKQTSRVRLRCGQP